MNSAGGAEGRNVAAVSRRCPIATLGAPPETDSRSKHDTHEMAELCYTAHICRGVENTSRVGGTVINNLFWVALLLIYIVPTLIAFVTFIALAARLIKPERARVMAAFGLAAAFLWTGMVILNPLVLAEFFDRYAGSAWYHADLLAVPAYDAPMCLAVSWGLLAAGIGYIVSRAFLDKGEESSSQTLEDQLEDGETDTVPRAKEVDEQRQQQAPERSIEVD